MIYFMSDRDIPFANGQIGLYGVNLDDASAIPQAVRLTPDHFISEMDRQNGQPDGKQLYTSNGDGDWEIYFANGDGTNIVNLTDNSSDDLFPVWRPQGS